jgi:predicted 3-demethylubiquinone-9 3-methyltransferase (glyoxalase superfamily)
LDCTRPGDLIIALAATTPEHCLISAGNAWQKREETDRYWNAIVGNGGQESQCGWCKDRWGLSWQITRAC